MKTDNISGPEHTTATYCASLFMWRAAEQSSSCSGPSALSREMLSWPMDPSLPIFKSLRVSWGI